MNPDQQPGQEIVPQGTEPQEQTPPTQSWQYTSGQLSQQQEPEYPQESSGTDEVLATWSASEFVSHEKSKSWYVYLALVSVVVAIILFVITKSWMSALVVVVLAVVFGIYGSAKPQIVTYTITPEGISIEQKHFSFTSFKGFSVIAEGPLPYIQFVPQKRLAVPITIYTEPDKIDQIAEIIGQFVPYDQKKQDFVDKLSTKLRF